MSTLNKTNALPYSNYSFRVKVKSFIQLLKFRLSFLVVFSAGFGYVLASTGAFDWFKFAIVLAAGFMVTASSNIVNQIIERNSDKLMNRTQARPMPLGVFSVSEASWIAFTLLASGMFLFMQYVNLNTALLSLISFILYAFAYTPLKTIHPIAVFVGAIPGALPPMIGWVAFSNDFGWEPGILFAIQFVWQFPHFWAIAWVLDEDYSKAGIKLLPVSGKTAATAFQIMIYTMLLIPLGFVPYLLGMTGVVSSIIATICGVLFLAQTFYLMKVCTNKAALMIMFGSFIYLPIVQIAYMWDKI